jgi:hypothetical protein
MGIRIVRFAEQVAIVKLRHFQSWHLFLLAGVSALGVWPMFFLGFGALADAVPEGLTQELVIGGYKSLVAVLAAAIISLTVLAISRASSWVWLAGILGLAILLTTLTGAVGSWIVAECHGHGRNCL